MEMVRLHAIFASHSSRLQPSATLVAFTRASAPEASRGHAFRLAENGVRWTRATCGESAPTRYPVPDRRVAPRPRTTAGQTRHALH
eukprot:916710-Prymnesium_polylepis.1